MTSLFRMDAVRLPIHTRSRRLRENRQILTNQAEHLSAGPLITAAAHTKVFKPYASSKITTINRITDAGISNPQAIHGGGTRDSTLRSSHNSRGGRALVFVDVPQHPDPAVRKMMAKPLKPRVHFALQHSSKQISRAISSAADTGLSHLRRRVPESPPNSSLDNGSSSDEALSSSLEAHSSFIRALTPFLDYNGGPLNSNHLRMRQLPAGSRRTTFLPSPSPSSGFQTPIRTRLSKRLYKSHSRTLLTATSTTDHAKINTARRLADISELFDFRCNLLALVVFVSKLLLGFLLSCLVLVIFFWIKLVL
ncbi:uncharacterized protein FIBRA_05194 [Fibroporia radiculosa]|uniref:Uncharacterized protein n=1 Tax=Fibroporia radiculosa TaxID=599839 RepID=J4H3D3_9APHY|nr:uncharacterized protein FIBRA_05194 [Fibroporia radiculosa]CCM03074.1 predicted protein [Fibroporia radiculosa]